MQIMNKMHTPTVFIRVNFQMKPSNKYEPKSRIPVQLYTLLLNWGLGNGLLENERSQIFWSLCPH